MSQDDVNRQPPALSHSQASLNSHSGSTPILIRQTTSVQNWLAKLGLSDAEFSEAELATLKELITVDVGWRSQARWASIDSLFTKFIQLGAFPWRYQRDLATPPPYHRRFVFPTNRAVSLNHPDSIRRMMLADVFRQAGEYYLDNTLLVFFTFMIFYNFSTTSAWGVKLLWDQLQNNDLTAAESLVISLSQWPKWALSLIGVSPALYAGYRVGITWKRLHAPEPKSWTHQPRYRCYGRELPWSLVTVPTAAQEAAIGRLLTNPSMFGRWWRWILPTPPCTKNATQLVHLLPMAISWNGRVTHTSARIGVTALNGPATIFRLVDLLAKLALTESGLTQLRAIHALKQVAHGVSLGDLASLSSVALQPEIIQEHVRAKITALATLKRINQLDRRTHCLLQRWAAKVYANYQLWALGAYEFLGWQTLPYSAYKAIKLYFSIHLYAIIVKTIIEAIRCPDKPGFSFGTGYAPWASDYSEECFNELVKQFGFWPGQPASSLVDQIPNYHIKSPYQLDLSNRGSNINGFQVADIMQGFARFGILVNKLNLANNTINTAREFDTLMPTLSDLTLLDLSGNGIGRSDSSNTIALGQGLAHLTCLTLVDLSNNLFGLLGSKGTIALSQGLAQLIGLRSLDLSHNTIGNTGSSGTIALSQGLAKLTRLTTLSFSGNRHPFTRSNGTFALSKALAQLTGLTSLDFSSNEIGVIGPKPTAELGQSLANLTGLKSLDLSYNSIGNTDSSSGTIVLGQGLAHLTGLESLNLSGNNIGIWDAEATTTLTQGLAHLTGLTTLDLSKNYIGYIGFNCTTALGQGIAHLTGLASLDLSGNQIGSTNSKGTIALGQGLAYLTNLNSLDLSHNGLTAHEGNLSSLTTVLTAFRRLKSFEIKPQTPSLSNTIINDINQALLNTHVNHQIKPNIRTAQDLKDYLSQLPKNLTKINLSGLFIYPNASLLKTLCIELTKFKLLNALDLSANLIGSHGPKGTIALSQGLAYLSGLTSLDLSGNDIGSSDPKGTIALGQGLAPLTDLTSLDLSTNEIGRSGSAGTVALAQAFARLTRLTSLDLGNNWIGDINYKGTMALGQGLAHLTGLTTLDLSKNYIGNTGSKGTIALSQGLAHLTGITSLYLSFTYMGYTGSNGTMALGQGIGHLTGLTSLDLTGTLFGNTDCKGTIALSLGLAYLTKLTSFSLCTAHCIIGSTGPAGPTALMQTLPKLPNLITIRLGSIQNLTWSEATQGLSTVHRNQLEAVCRKQLCFGKHYNTTDHTHASESRYSSIFSQPSTAHQWADTSDGHPPCVFPSGATNIISSSEHGPRNALLPRCTHSEPPQPLDGLNQLLQRSLLTGFVLGVRDESSHWLASRRLEMVYRYGTLGIIAYMQGWDSLTALGSVGMSMLSDYCQLGRQGAAKAVLAMVMLNLSKELMRHPETAWGLLVIGIALSQFCSQVSYTAGRHTVKWASTASSKMLPQAGLFARRREGVGRQPHVSQAKPSACGIN